jgi:hypothetical protein
MKFWVYAIDWRSMAIEILAERPNVSLANAVAAGYVASLPVAERDDFAAFKTVGVTPITPDIEAAVQQFKRLNGRVA